MAEKGKFTTFDSPMNVQKPKPDPGPENNYDSEEAFGVSRDPMGLLPSKGKKE